jgi:hypothetical protein
MGQDFNQDGSGEVAEPEHSDRIRKLVSTLESCLSEADEIGLDHVAISIDLAIHHAKIGLH